MSRLPGFSVLKKKQGGCCVLEGIKIAIAAINSPFVTECEQSHNWNWWLWL